MVPLSEACHRWRRPAESSQRRILLGESSLHLQGCAFSDSRIRWHTGLFIVFSLFHCIHIFGKVYVYESLCNYLLPTTASEWHKPRLLPTGLALTTVTWWWHTCVRCSRPCAVHCKSQSGVHYWWCVKHFDTEHYTWCNSLAFCSPWRSNAELPICRIWNCWQGCGFALSYLHAPHTSHLALLAPRHYRAVMDAGTPLSYSP